MKALLTFSLLLILLFCPVAQAQAVVDPLAVPNNKFGIHLISSTPDESAPASQLVNSSGGDWGYITILVRSSDRDQSRWQTFFNDLRRRHLIPIVRLATQAEGSNWKRPYIGEEQAWADFLDSLVWPTKNRYVTIYNEPNQGQEWAGQVDAADYARTLDTHITALKNKNPDFFVMNAGFDASAPNKPPAYGDQLRFMQEMNAAVPGIFNRLDGWASHSYPNPGFVGSPNASGRGTVRGWVWELQILQSLGVTKDLPVFITETGWKHAEGVDYDKSLPAADTVAEYYKDAFLNAWSSNRVVAVTPFLLDYQSAPFDHFSFKRLTGESSNQKILGATFPDYYSPFQTIADMSKTAGLPVQENKAELIKGELYPSLVAGEHYTIPLTFKNTGQSIWGERGSVSLVATQGQKELGILPVQLLGNQRVEPGQEATFLVPLNAPQSGHTAVTLQLYNGNQPFESAPLERTIEIKSPVTMVVETALKWKDNPVGEYILDIHSDFFETSKKVEINQRGYSEPILDRQLIPDRSYDFTLKRQYYKPKTLHLELKSGGNTLDFGELEPDFGSVLFKPLEFLKLLPISE